jgi:hypothetical protein
MPSSAAGLTVAKSCPDYNHRTYAIAEPSRLIDPAAWDGSDLFIVWPLPLFRFASEHLANILREEKITGVKLTPAVDIPLKRGNGATPVACWTGCLPVEPTRWGTVSESTEQSAGGKFRRRYNEGLVAPLRAQAFASGYLSL